MSVNKHYQINYKGYLIAGIDEAGRGPLAGPVVASSVIFDRDTYIDGVNDSIKHAKKLAVLLSNVSCKINLIPLNSFNGSDYRRSKESTMKSFKKYLIEKGVITTLRVTRGDGVDAACGQLVGELSNTIKGKNLIKHRSI